MAGDNDGVLGQAGRAVRPARREHGREQHVRRLVRLPLLHLVLRPLLVPRKSPTLVPRKS